MILSHKHKFIFLKTRKTAGTSLEIAFSQQCGPDDIITPIARPDEILRSQMEGRGPQNYRFPPSFPRWRQWLTGPFYNQRHFYNHMPASEVIDSVGQDLWNDYLTFTIERNSYDKAISVYYWVTRRKNKPKPSLEEFLNNIPEKKLSNWDLYSLNDKPSVDFIIRYNHMQEDLETLQEKLGLEPIILPQTKNKSRKDRRHYTEVLSAEARQRVEVVCAKEIQHFGYEWKSESHRRAA